MASKSNSANDPSAPAGPVVVNAIPVATESQSEPIQVEAHAERLPRTELERLGLENERIGVCRRCRRQFERPAGVHDGSAQYYRCPECTGLKVEDIINSCAIS